jgi:DNA processing protein
MDIKKEEIIRWLKFCEIRGIGSSRMLRLLGIFSTFNNIYSANSENLFKTGIFTESMIEEFNKLKEDFHNDYENYILNLCEKENIEVIPFYSEKYPLKLKNLPDAPLTLYAKGDINILNQKKIAIVGSRKSTEESKKWAYNIASELTKQGLVIISGGAKGIDIEAHKAALNHGGKTICVLGSGLIRTYPAEHREIFEEILGKGGLLLSELSPERSVDTLSLPRRNRIISGLSIAMVLATSSTQGGSKIQLKIASKQRIPVFCPKLDLNLFPNEGIVEAIRDYSAKEIYDISPVLEEVKKEDAYFSKQKTL